jgi:hypothetical protein
MLRTASDTRVPAAAWVAGALAVLPLLAALVVLWSPGQLGLGELPRQAGPIYAALLVSLFGGIRWGAALGPVAPAYAGREFILSVLPAYVSWIALALRPELALCLLLSTLLLQALWDVLAVEEGRLPYWYGKLRMLLTAAAAIAILAMLGERLFR